MRVAIYGAGAMGTLLGAYIASNGKQIDLITRNAGHVAALNEKGARIVGNDNFRVDVNAFTPDEMSGVYDIIFLMTKQRENSKILATLRDFLTDDGVICTLQNGLPEPSVMEAVGRKRCLGCAVSWGASTVGEGVAELTSKKKKMTFALGSMDGDSPWLGPVKEYLECAGRVTVEKNFFGARWSKLAINSAFSPVSGVTGLTFGEVSKNKRTRKISLKLLNEAFDVARECGVKLEPIQGHNIVKLFGGKDGFKMFVALRLLPLAMSGHKKLMSGMYFDLNAGKKCDVDFVNGVICRLGRKFGVKTPANDALIDMCAEIENGERKISADNIDFLYKKLFIN